LSLCQFLILNGYSSEKQGNDKNESMKSREKGNENNYVL